MPSWFEILSADIRASSLAIETSDASVLTEKDFLFGSIVKASYPVKKVNSDDVVALTL